jgi:drug/metabolite transporter (DMT)-like permease
MVATGSVIFASVGTWLGLTSLPTSTLLCMRMALTAVLLILLGGGRRWARQVLGTGVLRRLIVLGVIDGLQIYTFMLALRELDVALAVFLSYLSPIYVALVAPRLLRQRTEGVVVWALVLAVAGIAVMLAPGLLDPGLQVSALGIGLALASGLVLAAFFLLAKTLSPKVDGTAMLVSNGVIVGVLMLPPALVQWAAQGWGFTRTDLWVVLVLSVFCTALAGTIFLHGMRHIPVQHTSIVGLLEPACAPLFAFVILAQRPSVWTLLGGALIVAGAALVVLLSRADEGLAGTPEEVVGETSRGSWTRDRE